LAAFFVVVVGKLDEKNAKMLKEQYAREGIRLGRKSGAYCISQELVNE